MEVRFGQPRDACASRGQPTESAGAGGRQENVTNRSFRLKKGVRYWASRTRSTHRIRRFRDGFMVLNQNCTR
jgi:hypothetical protein